MEQIKKIIGINLIILLAYTIIIQLMAQLQSDPSHKGLIILIITLYALIAHIGINVLISIIYFFKDGSDKGKAFMLSSLVILLVGFSSCWGNAFLSEMISN